MKARRRGIRLDFLRGVWLGISGDYNDPRRAYEAFPNAGSLKPGSHSSRPQSTPVGLKSDFGSAIHSAQCKRQIAPWVIRKPLCQRFAKRL